MGREVGQHLHVEEDRVQLRLVVGRLAERIPWFSFPGFGWSMVDGWRLHFGGEVMNIVIVVYW